MGAGAGAGVASSRDSNHDCPRTPEKLADGPGVPIQAPSHRDIVPLEKRPQRRMRTLGQGGVSGPFGKQSPKRPMATEKTCKASGRSSGEVCKVAWTQLQQFGIPEGNDYTISKNWFFGRGCGYSFRNRGCRILKYCFAADVGRRHWRQITVTDAGYILLFLLGW